MVVIGAARRKGETVGGMHRFGCEQMQTVRERGADQFGVNGRKLALCTMLVPGRGNRG